MDNIKDNGKNKDNKNKDSKNKDNKITKEKIKYNPNHQIVIRHFKTESNERIDYTHSYKEAEPYINFIKKYISKFGIKEIDIKTSPLERTLMTSLILYIKLSDIVGLTVHKPRIEKYLERDPSKNKLDQTFKKFKNDYKTDGKLVINITHSSVYSTVFLGLMSGMNNENTKLSDITNNKKIHHHSLSFLADIDSEVKYGFNILME